jgi:quercetin dioxygenase-like cupin family protein
MRFSTPLLALLLPCSFLGFAWSRRVSGQETAPETVRIPQFENADVRVWRSIVAPGSPLPLHRHEHPRVIIALVGGTMKIVEEGGASDIHEWQSGKAYWLPANPPGSRHMDVNIGDKPIEVMVVELQQAR